MNNTDKDQIVEKEDEVSQLEKKVDSILTEMEVQNNFLNSVINDLLAEKKKNAELEYINKTLLGEISSNAAGQLSPLEK